MIFNKKTNKQTDNIVYYGSFTFNTDTKTIVDFRNNLNKVDEVVIPEEINGVTVENIGDYAFRKKGLKSMNVSKTIKNFGRGCFLGNDFEKVIVPEGIIVPERAYLV